MDSEYIFILKVATVLTVYGIETGALFSRIHTFACSVATVLTVYGIETLQYRTERQ